jgi:hypothetical protein
MRPSKVLILVATLVVLLASGCRKPSSNGIAEALSRTGIVAYQGAGIYIEEGPNSNLSLSWRGALDFGGELKMAANYAPRDFVIGDQTMKFVPIAVDSGALDGIRDKIGTGPGWIRMDYYGAGAEAAAVTHPTGGSGSLPALDRGALIAVLRTRTNGSLAPAIVIDQISKTRIDGTKIDLGALSFERDDVRAATCLAKAAATRDEAEAKSILEDASRAIPNSIFADLFKAKLGLGESEEVSSSPAIEALVAKLTVKRDSVVIHASPAPNAPSVGTLAMDDEVDTTGRSAEAETTSEGTAHWYRIKSPTDGWVFGLDLVGAD